MKILLLGAGGFVGSHLVEHLVARREHESSRWTSRTRSLRHLDPAAVPFHRYDVRDGGTALETVIAGADVVVDLIAYANPSLYVSSPLEVFELNFLRNLDIAKLCIRYGKRLIQYSSAEVYGKAERRHASVRRTPRFVPRSGGQSRWIYATGNSCSNACSMHTDRPASWIRPSCVRSISSAAGSTISVPAEAVGGPRVFPHFMSALLTGGPIRLVNGGHVHRAFLHIADANAAFQTLLDAHASARQPDFQRRQPGNDTTIREFAL